MIFEIAQIDVKPGMETDFETGVKNAAPLFKRANGCTGMTLQRHASAALGTLEQRRGVPHASLEGGFHAGLHVDLCDFENHGRAFMDEGGRKAAAL